MKAIIEEQKIVTTYNPVEHNLEEILDQFGEELEEDELSLLKSSVKDISTKWDDMPDGQPSVDIYFTVVNGSPLDDHNNGDAMYRATYWIDEPFDQCIRMLYIQRYVYNAAEVKTEDNTQKFYDHPHWENIEKNNCIHKIDNILMSIGEVTFQI